MCHLLCIRTVLTVLCPHSHHSYCLSATVSPIIPVVRVPQGVARLCALIFSRAQPKRIGTQVVSGPMLAGLAEAYVCAINEGAVPTIATAWQVRHNLLVSVALVLVRHSSHPSSTDEGPRCINLQRQHPQCITPTLAGVAAWQMTIQLVSAAEQIPPSHSRFHFGWSPQPTAWS